MNDPFLSRVEVARLSARRRADAQCRMLDRMGIEYLRDGDGRPLVVRDALYQREKTAYAGGEPNWSAINEPGHR